MGYARLDLSGKTALVTGGNGGIGLGYAEALAEAGAAICIWGRNEDKNAAAVEELRRFGGRAEAIRCDVSREEEVEAAFAQTLDMFGQVDAVFANAGVGSPGNAFHEVTAEEWRRVLSVNLDGVFFTFRAAIRHMLERRGGGSLVATSSITSKFGFSHGQHYSASKAAVGSLVRGISSEYARRGIRANAIAPGWIESEMTGEVFQTQMFQEKILKRIPQRRWGRRDDLGGIAVYLASDASAYHTGDTIFVDGGYASF